MRITSFILSLVLPAIIHAGPIVTSVTPSSGAAIGGNVVQIHGSGFAGTTDIHFGVVPADSFTVASDSFITVTAPATFAPGTIDITVTNNSGTSPVSIADQYTYIEGNWYGYVSTLDSTYLPINLTTNAPGTYKLLPGVSLGNGITPDGQIAIIPDTGNTLVIGQLANQQLLPPIIDMDASAMKQTAITPDGKTAYIGINSPTGIQLFDIASQTFGAIIPLPSGVNDIAITPDGTRLYACTSGEVYPVDLSLGLVGLPISLPISFQIRITPDGRKAFLTNVLGNNASYIDLTTNNGYNTIPLGQKSGGVAISPDGKTAYYLTLNSEELISVDTETLNVVSTLFLSHPGETIAITPDSKTAYIVPAESDIITVDLTTIPYSLGNPISLESLPAFIVITPDQAPIASFKTGLGLPGLPTAFDASASVSPVGTIVDYAWDFGDGNTLNTSLPTVDHTYALTGTYTVTLTVTNSAGTSTFQTFTGQTVSNNGGPSARSAQVIQIFPLLPPANVRGFQKENKFLMQTDIVNIVVWTAPGDSAPAVSYKVYSDAGLTNLLDVVPANGELTFIQHNVRERPYTYYLVSVDAQGNVSAPVSVLVEPEREE